ncbi:MAG TPA: hypothetical protein DHI91_00185 [Candidatus Portnoybacteria bacterium]|uniref:DUF3048 domain-containing protein n=1 Tax=Candidatus Portnoybacteria bacterium CG02_land_8_20_14_3_00_45_8 TaxID=1974807 RepID=A0A2M7D5X8_9BACT|nr:MAG: hypothetical protein COS30_02245 [Candidatus Portnoybacteria bacterium CG02_land_8_20_14_3_00_45_8]HCX27545.1 hypothetical protein [Candidatus Portnoybacteria bacterium]
MKKYLPVTLFIILIILGGYFIFSGKGKVVDISGSGSSASPSASPKLSNSPISGLECANANRRPIAAMLSGDAITRPLSGLNEADLVFDMPVITDSITRMMAVYVCNSPKEIGSIRSTRDDFIPLARGLDAILAHWGGSHFALALLDKGIMDNIDALKNPANSFFRKSGIAAPHNGFTSYSRLTEAAQKLDYRLTGEVNGYLHLEGEISPVATSTKTLDLGFPGDYHIKYTYSPQDNTYWRWRGGTKEIDKNNGQQVGVKNVVAMIAPSRQIEGQYNTVQVEGEGPAKIYRNGEEISGTWKKDAKNQTSKLYFYDAAGQEIKFVTGSIWVEVVQPNQSISWQ